jgi:peroxidase
MAAALDNLPRPTSRLPELLTSFSSKGLDARDLAALSGAHTIGMARCSTFRPHIYGDANVDAAFAAQVRASVCPLAGGDDNIAPLELQQPDNFDNNYFTDLLTRRVLLRSDQELFGSSSSNGTTDGFVQAYAANAATFAADFAIAMVKLGSLPLTGDVRGEVRLNCRRPN